MEMHRSRGLQTKVGAEGLSLLMLLRALGPHTSKVHKSLGEGRIQTGVGMNRINQMGVGVPSKNGINHIGVGNY